jgi:NADH-quinone oxidoreductase subunit L
MGGLRHMLPITWILMWIATLAIAGVPLFAGFFSKDEILGTVFERARGSSLSDATWLGIPGGPLLYAVYGACLVAAFLTAVYMTRLMLYTFHGSNRTGEQEAKQLRDAPAIMTGPLVVLGVLSATGGLLNVPDWLPIARVDVLARWLAPVTGPATQQITRGIVAESDPHLAALLAGVAAIVAVLGIVTAIVVLKPAALRPAREPQPIDGPVENLVEHKFYVDEIYERLFIEPTLGLARDVLWQGVDALIDGIVNLTARIWVWLGGFGSALQNGEVGSYAWALVAGVVLVLGAVALRS